MLLFVRDPIATACITHTRDMAALCTIVAIASEIVDIAHLIFVAASTASVIVDRMLLLILKLLISLSPMLHLTEMPCNHELLRNANSSL